MLVIHWSKHNNTDDILKNGIRPKTRKKENSTDIKGVWCYPYTRNKTLNNNWKRNLKSWRGENSNFNGFVFKLEDGDFPIYAGSFAGIGVFPERSIYKTYNDFSEVYGKYFNPLELEKTPQHSDEVWLDYQDFELILIKRIEVSRIIKIIKDRTPTNTRLAKKR